MKFEFENCRAFVCGASQGIGEATAIALAKCGVPLTLLARNSEKLEFLSNQIIKDYNVHCDNIAIDINNLDQLKIEIDQKLKEHGSYQILINNSSGPKGGPVLETSDVDFITFFQNHLLAAQTLVRSLLPGMQETKYGRIINIISTSVKQPIPNLGASNTIRGAMASWGKTLSMEVGEYVTVNNVLPGFTATGRLESLAKGVAQKTHRSIEDIYEQWKQQVPLRRFAKPEETAHAILFLASNAASYINGINLPVDGGRLGTL